MDMLFAFSWDERRSDSVTHGRNNQGFAPVIMALQSITDGPFALLVLDLDL
jgi:hypothetical protein